MFVFRRPLSILSALLGNVWRIDGYVGILRAMAQGVVDKNEREHGFGDGGGAQADAGVVSAVGGEFDRIAVDVDAAARCSDGTGGFDGDVDVDVLAGADAAEDAAGVVGQEALRGKFVAVFAAALDDAAETCADFHAFDGVDAHHGVGDFGIEAVENGFA